MKFVQAKDGARLAYEEAGAGPAIVFAHSLGGSRAVWGPLVDIFRSRYRCIAYDLRGQGDSETTPGPYDMDLLAADALDLLDGLGIERCVFAGVSMGGMVAQHLALRAPQRLRALVLADTAAGFDAAGRAAWADRIVQIQRDGLAPLVDTMMARWFTPGFRAEHPAKVAGIAADFSRASVEGYIASCAAIRDHDLVQRLGEIVCPSLVLCGELDPSTPLPLSQVLAAGLPTATLEILPGLHHLPVFEAPGLVSGVIEDFLQVHP